MDIRIIAVSVNEMTTAEGNEKQQFLVTLDIPPLGVQILETDYVFYMRLRALIRKGKELLVEQNSSPVEEKQEDQDREEWTQPEDAADLPVDASPIGVLAGNTQDADQSGREDGVTDPITLISQWQGNN